LKPDSVVGFYGIGVAKAILCHQSGMRCYEAIEIMKKTLAIVPDYRKANFNIGTCYAKLGDYENALLFLNNALKSDNTNGEYYLNRGFIRL
jgi:tetratricopeptide (TPR) repeat protein